MAHQHQILSKLKISNKQLISYKYLNDKVKSVLKSERGISDLDLKFAKQQNVVYFKNGKKQVVNFKMRHLHLICSCQRY